MEPMTFEEFKALAYEGFNVIPLYQTFQLDRETPVSLFDRFPRSAFFLLESAAMGDATGRYSFIGLDRRWRITTEGQSVVGHGVEVDETLQPLDALRAVLSRYTSFIPAGLPDFTGGAVGFITYDYVRRIEKLPRPADSHQWPDIDFSFPGAILIVDHLRHSTTVVVNAFTTDAPLEDSYKEATDQLSETVSILLAQAPATNPDVERLVATAPSMRTSVNVRELAASLSNFTLEQYSAVVEKAKEYIYAGDIFQVVPSQQFKKPSSVNPFTLYRVLRSLNPSPYMYLLDSGVSQIVGASPEMLMRVHDGIVSTRPIAGTRARGANEQEDRELEEDLLHDEKEISEHVMLVDLGRNDVGRVAEPGTVRVERLAKIERFSHLMHLVSQVDGTLREGLDVFDAFNAIFPAGTLTGAPKVRAMEIIDEFEPVHRGPYGGAVGYFSLSGNADFAITIRTVSLRQGFATVQAGGGVVADSTPAFEYQECINKASAPLLALTIAESV
jgi:anthranilate synthase component I